MRILHTADLHLGQVLYHNYERVDEYDCFFSQLGSWCHEYRPDALVVSGDIFDIQQPSAKTKAYFNNTFATLHRAFPTMTIVVTAGNHDSPSRIEADHEVWALSGVVLVGEPPSSDLLAKAEGDRLQELCDRYIVELPTGFIVAIPFALSQSTVTLQRLLDRVAERNANQLPVVMMAHTAVAGSDFTGHGDIGTLRTVATDSMGRGYDYMALGHIHRPQTIGQPLGDENLRHSTYAAPTARYSGSALHVSCDEQYPHSISLVDIDHHGGTVTVERLRINELRHFHTLPLHGNAYTNAEQIYADVKDFCHEHERGYIRLRIDRATSLPPDFEQQIYAILQATGDEVRYNPKIIWENQDEEEAKELKLQFEVAELQQMTDPLEFIRRTKDKYPEIDMDSLEADFDDIRRMITTMDEEDQDKKKR